MRETRGGGRPILSGGYLATRISRTPGTIRHGSVGRGWLNRMAYKSPSHLHTEHAAEAWKEAQLFNEQEWL